MRLRYLALSICLAVTASQSGVARATTGEEQHLMIVDIADELLPRSGGEVRVFVIIPGSQPVTGQLELVVERYRAGAWRRLGFVTRCQSFETSTCDLGRKLPPSRGYSPPRTPRVLESPRFSGRTAFGMVMRFRPIPTGQYRFHAELSRGGRKLTGKVLSNQFEVGVGEKTHWPGNQSVNIVVSAAAATVPYVGVLQRWDASTGSWIEPPDSLTAVEGGSQLNGQQSGLHRICTTLNSNCTGMWLSDQLAPNTAPLTAIGYGINPFVDY